MATIIYLDPDDEITTAATRIRTADAPRVGLVVPFGSRVATSRINFRLLAREAQVIGRRLDIIATDTSARALALSAGLPVFASVGEYEDALDEDAADPSATGAAAGAATATAETTGPGPKPAGRARAGSAEASASAGAEERAAERVAGARERAGFSALDAERQAELDEIVARSRQPTPAGPRRRGPGAGTIVGVLVLVAAVVVSAVAGATVLPAAEITVTPRIVPVGPMAITITADPRETAIDEVAGLIPAMTLEIPVVASGEFSATGKRVEQTKATGGVRWTNCDPTASYTIAKGTIVKTADGTGFATEEQVFLPVAGLSGTPPNLEVKCTTSDVAVTASTAGEAGNVAAGTIKVVPAKYNRTVVSVSNAKPTTGGSRTEFPKVAQADVDAALASLRTEVEAQFAVELQNPDLVPSGATVFPETAVPGEPVPTIDPTTLVDQEVATFALGMAASGTVLAVDASPVRAIAEARLTAAVEPGYQLVEGSIAVAVGEGSVSEGLIDFPVTGTARQVRPVDAAELKQIVFGLPKAEAEAALAPYGDAVVALWPGWVTSVPTLEQRVTLTVADPVDITSESTPGPTPGPTPRPTAAATPSLGPEASSAAPGSEPVPSG